MRTESHPIKLDNDIMLRDVSPMLLTHCPVCTRSDCSNMKFCPLAQAKWFGNFISVEDFIAFQGQQTTRPETLPLPNTKSIACEQLSLF